MAVQDIPRREGPFVGDGEARAYPFPFLVFKETDVRVVRSVSEDDNAGEEELSLGTDYTVSLNEDQETSPGGTVRLTTPLPAGIRLSIVSSVEATQEVVLTNHDGFYPEILNGALDKLTVLAQELQEQTSRNLQVPVTSEKTPSELLSDVMSAKVSADKVIPHIPSIETAAGAIDKITTVADNVDDVNLTADNIDVLEKVASGLDVTRDGADVDYGHTTDPLATEVAASGALVAVANAIEAVQELAKNLDAIVEGGEIAESVKENADRAEAAAEAAVGQLHAVSYEAQVLKQAERIQAKANIGADYFVNVKDFGAKGDGVTDDTAAFRSANASGNSVLIPDGKYVVSEAITTGNFVAANGVTFVNKAVTYAPLAKKKAPYGLSFVIRKDGSDDALASDWGTSREKAFLTFEAAFRHFVRFYEVTDTRGVVNFNFGPGDFGDIELSQNNPGCTIRIYGTDTQGGTRLHLINVNLPGTVYLGNLAFSCIELRQCTLWATGKMFVIKDDRHTQYAVASGVLTTDFILDGSSTLTFAEPVTYDKAPFYVNCELRAGAKIEGQENVTAPYKYYATDNEFVNCASSVYDQLTWAKNYYVEPYANSIQLRLGKFLQNNKGFGGPVVKSGSNYIIFACGIAACWGSASITSSTSTQVTMPVEMLSSTTYFVQISSRSPSVSVAAPANVDKTGTTFVAKCASESSVTFDWFACGMTNGI